MCGIAGYINSIKGFDETQSVNVLKDFCNILKNRGPDSKGYWYDLKDEIFLSHTRLSINDLSENGSQPMTNSKKNLVIIFNGEVYNHLFLRNTYLQKYNIKWTSGSDTETILYMIDFYGLEKTLALSEGMFSFCLYNRNLKKAFLVRDKMGEKPLYYGFVNNSIVFGSQIKIFNYFPNFEKKISKDALNLFLNYSYIPEPFSIYENIYKLDAGEIAEIDLNDLDYISQKSFKKIKKKKWYNEASIIEQSNHEIVSLNVNKKENYFDEILNESVKETLTSDVEVGTFLSGGIDSSLISAIAQKHSKNKIKTFSICFEDQDYNEQKFSKAVSDHIVSNHNEKFAKSADMFKFYNDITDIYDEPFADSSQLPTVLLSRFASKSVKVCLTGDGADELFGGYNRYSLIDRIFKKTKYFPKYILNQGSKLISNLNYEKLENFTNNINQILLKNSYPQLNDKIQKLGRLLTKSSPLEMYLELIKTNRNWNVPLIKNNSSSDFLNSRTDDILKSNNLEPFSLMMEIDKHIYLKGDILHKVDRAGMYYGLETRIPFLNSKIVNFSSAIPSDFKIRDNQSKYIVKELAKKYLPREIINRKKMGFSIPLGKWINDNYENFQKNFLANRDLFEITGFNFDSILLHLNEHKEKKNNWSHILWNLIILERWFEKYIN